MRYGLLISKRRFVPAVLGLVFLALGLGGCSSWNQPGETSLERRVRLQRTMRVSYHQMVEDIDKLLLLDEPSMLSEKRLP